MMALEKPIIEGGEYIYASKRPLKCHGHRYRVLRVNVQSVPEYTQKILVEALTGPDKGMLFVCSPNNFSTRYTQVKIEARN